MMFSHVLISRPEPEAAGLAAMVEAAGRIPVLIPAFRFELEHPGFEFSSAWVADKRRLAIFSSTRAVAFGLRQLPAGFLDGVEIAAIGPATSNALEESGVRVSILPRGAFNSEALLSHPRLAGAPGQAMIFAAPGGRRKLREGLEAAGWQVQVAHVYRSRPLEPAEEQLDKLMRSEGILSVWTSANALDHLATTLAPAAWERVCEGGFVVTSHRLADHASEFARGEIFVTRGPGNEAISGLIQQLI